ncbi:MAG TPA: glycosyltransferase [Streptosporangiaceae bacterium]|nr:glycosyltransferase [Streptosporangiaceae bacterium]
MSLLREVAVPPLDAAELEPIIGPERYTRLLAEATMFRERLGRRTIWNVSSTAVGGGVAEMLRVLAGYTAGLGIAIRWTVIGGDPGFFAITKRVHNQIHGEVGSAGTVGPADAGHYEQVLAANADELLRLVRPGDVVLLHDPQTAGLVPAVIQAGARVVWRCHIGVDWQNDVTRAAWDFLRPYLAPANGYVFTRRQYVPAWVPGALTRIIPPSIDPYSAKNEELGAETVAAILAIIGVLGGGPPPVPGRFTRHDRTSGEVTRAARVTGETRPGPADPVVVQVSRWDRLKDMAGVMRGFAEHVAPGGDGYLILAGPEVSGVADDPEGGQVLAECVAQWQGLPASARARVLLVTLPLDDIEENAAMINAIQRHASVIVQKSLAEGFGLTVAEGMWKGRPVVGSAVGGILDQITDGTGLLVRDPADLAAFGSQVRWLLDHPAEAGRMGRAGQEHVRKHYLGDRHLLQYADLFGSVIGG